MSKALIETRKKTVLSNKVVKRNPRSNHGFFLHQRGYHLGDIRCSACQKWINPNNPDEAKEITVSPVGRRYHDKRYCNHNGSPRGSSNFATVSRHRESRSRRLANIVRY